jgi:hypothetical protein
MRLVVAMTVSSLPHRINYLQLTLDSWSRVSGLKDWTVRFHVEPDDSLAKLNIDLIDSWAADMELTDVWVVHNPTRLGVLRNPWSAFDSAFALGAEFVLLVEEDVLVSVDVLEYFERTAQIFAEQKATLAVCGSYFGEAGDPMDIYLTQDFCPLTWGTWADRWRSVLRDTWDHDYSTGNSDGSEAGWDWNLKRRILPSNAMVCVFPRVSRSLHIGQHGVHMRPEEFAASQAPSFGTTESEL